MRSIGLFASIALTASIGLATAALAQSADGGKQDRIILRHNNPINSGYIAYAKREGIFERELGKLGVDIKWVQTTPGFSSNLELWQNGELDIHNANISPAIGALAKNIGVTIVATWDPFGTDFAGILATPESGIKTIKDLAGRRVAVNPAAKGEYLVLQALQTEGVPVESVERVPLQQSEAASAFATGKIEAWATFLVPYTTAIANGAVVLANEQQIGSVDNGVTIARRSLVEEHPEIFKEYIRIIRELAEKQRQDPATFENVFEQTGPRAISGARLEQALKTGSEVSIPRVPNDEDVRRIQKIADLFHANKVIDTAVDANDLVIRLEGVH